MKNSWCEHVYPRRYFIMKGIFLIAIAIATIGGASTDKAYACDFRLPTFEVAGFPISPLQVAVLGAALVEEGSATPTLKLAGMPASPHQIAVLTPRKPVKIVSAVAELNVAPPARAISDLPIAICVLD
jgi:hypothetical protein